jgi:hypothetical protein
MPVGAAGTDTWNRWQPCAYGTVGIVQGSELMFHADNIFGLWWILLILFFAFGGRLGGRRYWRGPRAQRWDRYPPPSFPASEPRGDTVVPLQAVLEEPPQRQLPPAAQRQVDEIVRKVDDLLRMADRFPAGSRNLYVLQRTKTDYLPATVDAYLALTPDYAARAVTPDGRTPTQLLQDQLQILDTKVDEISEDLQRDNVERLLANGRFLEEHFGHPPDGELKLPS